MFRGFTRWGPWWAKNTQIAPDSTGGEGIPPPGVRVNARRWDVPRCPRGAVARARHRDEEGWKSKYGDVNVSRLYTVGAVVGVKHADRPPELNRGGGQSASRSSNERQMVGRAALPEGRRGARPPPQ